jgi:signal peptidase I
MTDFDGPLMANAYPIADVLRSYIHGNRVARLTVSSNSMAPVLVNGDVIGLQHADRVRIKPGQIITFDDPGEANGLTTHRLVRTQVDDQEQLLMLTCGDHTLLFDDPWNAEALLGQVIWRVRNGRLLRLDQGPGRWLSIQVGLIAERERARISGVSMTELRLTGEDITLANNQLQLHRRNLYSRLLHTAGRSGRESLAFISLLFACRDDDFTGMERE